MFIVVLAILRIELAMFVRWLAIQRTKLAMREEWLAMFRRKFAIFTGLAGKIACRGAVYAFDT